MLDVLLQGGRKGIFRAETKTCTVWLLHDHLRGPPAALVFCSGGLEVHLQTGEKQTTASLTAPPLTGNTLLRGASEKSDVLRRALPDICPPRFNNLSLFKP